MIHNTQYGFNKLPMGEWHDVRTYLSNRYVKQRRLEIRNAKKSLRKMSERNKFEIGTLS